ncbi:arabinosyltransferase domain-containing protein [Actinomycetes bacterium M1A6_2h]
MRERITPRLVAIVAAIVGIVLTVAVPFLPVSTDDTTLNWPQNDSAASVTAPLIEYTPTTFDATIPCTAATQDGLLLSTNPKNSPDAERYGLIVSVSDRTLNVVNRSTALLSVPVSELPAGCSLTISSTSSATTVTLTGQDPVVRAGDERPQLSGIFTDLQTVPAGMQASANIDSRFTSTPTVLKLLAMIVGVLATLVALVALHRIDSLDGRRARRFLPSGWWKFGVADAVVVGILLLWHIIGANTADDGYLLGMARVSEGAGYMSNFFRYFGVPETPFGTPYYDLLALMTNVTSASVWMRIPALIAGIVTWLVISREVVPRLGRASRTARVPLWTGALVFLAFWLPYNNGLRPEPVVAMGVLLTWCSVERAIATHRLLPAATAILTAAFTLTAGPSGLICLAPLVAGLRPIVRIVTDRARESGLLAVVLPLIASGSAVLVAVFADQPFATVPVMQAAHEAAGPNVAWFDEYLRYQYLMNPSPDGSLARRFGVFVLVTAVVITIAVMLRKRGRIPGTAGGPARRLIGITIGAMLLMMWTPTKWTHHFGVYAGLAGSMAVLLAVAVGPSVVRSRRNRLLFASGILFLLALDFRGPNGYWYVSSYGVPWFDKPPSISGHGLSTGFLGLTVLGLLAALYFHVRDPYTHPAAPTARLWKIPPLTVAAAAVVLFEVLSLAKGAVTQYPAYSVGRSNVDALMGNSCGLANDVLVETDPNASMLIPVSGDVAGGLAGTESVGFTPNGVAGDLTSDESEAASGTANSVTNDPSQTNQETSTSAGTGGGAGVSGVNGSSVALPFGLDPARTPVLGSFGTTTPASLTSDWYRLPSERGDLISIAAAGRIRSVDKDGVVTPGQNLEVEYGRTATDGTVTALGRVTPIDIGPQPSWRNLRVPMSALPSDADTVRLVVSDPSLDPDQWLAVTPPRVPKTQTLNDLVGSTTPVLLDWAVGMNFPCQDMITHHDGVAEIPRYRIKPDRTGAVSTNAWQDHFGGGPLGWIDRIQSAQSMPSYLNDDWSRDWGDIEKYTPIDPDAVPAQLDVTEVTRSGFWSPGPIKTS